MLTSAFLSLNCVTAAQSLSITGIANWLNRTYPVSSFRARVSIQAAAQENFSHRNSLAFYHPPLDPDTVLLIGIVEIGYIDRAVFFPVQKCVDQLSRKFAHYCRPGPRNARRRVNSCRVRKARLSFHYIAGLQPGISRRGIAH